MDLLNESFKRYKMYGMDYFLARTTEMINELKDRKDIDLFLKI